MVNKKAIVLLFVANTISGISQGICMIAIPWYFTAILGWHTKFGIFYSCLTLCSIFWSLYAGTLVDKFDRKYIQTSYSILGFITLSVAAFCGQSMPENIWLISSIVFSFTILLYNIHYINLYSFAQEITPKKHHAKVISYLEVQGQATMIMGGAFAAILMDGNSNGNLVLLGFHWKLNLMFDKWELYELFSLDACTYLLSVFVLLALKYTPLTNRNKETDSAWQRVQTGWNFLKNRKALLIVGWASSAVFVSVVLISFYLMPSYVSNVLKAPSSVFASSELYFAFGAMLAGFLARFFLKNKHEVYRIIVLSGLACLVFIVFITNTKLALFYIANILYGFSNAAIRYNRVSYFWKLIPNEIMGRVSSFINLSSYIFRALLGFLFSIYIFSGAAGITLVMISLLIFISISTIIIYVNANKIKDLEF